MDNTFGYIVGAVLFAATVYGVLYLIRRANKKK